MRMVWGLQREVDELLAEKATTREGALAEPPSEPNAEPGAIPMQPGRGSPIVISRGHAPSPLPAPNDPSLRSCGVCPVCRQTVRGFQAHVRTGAAFVHSSCWAARPGSETPLPQPIDHPWPLAFPSLGGDDANTVGLLEVAISDSGREPVRQQRISASFYTQLVDDDVFLFNYNDNSAGNFLARGDISSNDLNIRAYCVLSSALQAEEYALRRREYRGLVVHRSGGVLARPLHKFFQLDQVPETACHLLDSKRIELVTRKLDGQMVYGIVVGGEVRFWTRSGPTEVGAEACQVVGSHPGDYFGLIRYLSAHQCTAIFEYIGKRSHKKAFEGHMPQVVLLAVRHHCNGGYWDYHHMENISRRFGIPLVERLLDLERLEDGDDITVSRIRSRVKLWHNCEGVVVRFTDGTWVKIKSDWWSRTGYSSQFSSKISARVAEEQLRLRERKRKLQHFSLRLAFYGLPFDMRHGDIAHLFPGCRQIQMVYGHSGRLRVALVAFSTVSERNEALWDPCHRDLDLETAYSSRARTCARHRVDTFYYVGCPQRG